MGGDLLDKSLPSKTLEQQFYDLLPTYLSIGMTYDEYMNGDCELVRYYREADKLKQERDNENDWLNGYYVYEALCRVAALFNPLAKEHKAAPYIQKPLDLLGREKKETEEEKNQRKLRELREKFIRMSKKNNGGK